MGIPIPPPSGREARAGPSYSARIFGGQLYGSFFFPSKLFGPLLLFQDISAEIFPLMSAISMTVQQNHRKSVEMQFFLS